ncbi:hypothetical protein ACP70R_034157 [Stipagrostis hirtigluma subsp. patula]
MAPTAASALPLSAAAAFVLLAAAALVASPASANEEVDALMAARRGLEDPGGVLASWDPNLVNPCTWFHVTCDDATNRVTRLDLTDLNLSGRLAPELGKLEKLQYMEIARNNLQGPIPPEFGNLGNLISLDLFNNGISGPIPHTLGNLKSLRFLRVDHNRLTGPIPRELTGLPNLVVVDMSNNDLCGTIPRSGSFANIPLNSFANNPRLKGPEVPGAGDSDC